MCCERDSDSLLLLEKGDRSLSKLWVLRGLKAISEFSVVLKWDEIAGVLSSKVTSFLLLSSSSSFFTEVRLLVGLTFGV